LALAALPYAASAATRSLEFGMSGSDVTTLQQNLITLGYLASGNAIGYFGPLTLAAVKKFQCAKSVVCTAASTGYGVYGPATQAAMQIALAPSQPTTIGSASLTRAATGAFEISGWVPDWRAASGTLDVIPHLTQMKSVMPFGYTVAADGTLVDSAHITAEPWVSFIAAAKAAGVRVVPTVEWGDGTQEQTILSDTTKRIALEDAIANLVKARGFDGIDIDFESKQAQTINYFSTFLKGLYARMGNKWVYCTVEARMPLEDRYSAGTTPPPDATEYANDYSALNQYCDRVELMAYDQGTVDVRLDTARFAPYAPVADPGWVEDIVRLAAQTISRNKLVLGVPTYGYEYQVTPLGAGGYQYQVLWAFNPKYATDLAAQLGVTPVRTSANEMGYIYNTTPNAALAVGPSFANTTQTQQDVSSTSVADNLAAQSASSQPFNFVTWSDATAIADKVALAHALGLRGVAVFSLGGAEDQAMWNILK